jgi:hypothetical protein
VEASHDGFVAAERGYIDNVINAEPDAPADCAGIGDGAGEAGGGAGAEARQSSIVTGCLLPIPVILRRREAPSKDERPGSLWPSPFEARPSAEHLKVTGRDRRRLFVTQLPAPYNSRLDCGAGWYYVVPMTKPTTDKPVPESKAEIAARLGLEYRDGWFILPSRGRPPITSELVQQLIEEADLEDAGLKPRTTMQLDVGDLRANSVEFTATELVVTLASGCKIVTPLDWYPRLAKASALQRANFEIMPMGIHWPELDEDLSIAGMLKGQRANG